MCAKVDSWCLEYLGYTYNFETITESLMQIQQCQMICFTEKRNHIPVEKGADFQKRDIMISDHVNH